MKAEERHKLKQNEFALAVARATESLGANRDRILLAIGGVIVLVVALSAYSWWSGRTAGQADAALSVAMEIYDAPIVPAPTVPGAVQQAGTYPSETARTEAALAAFQKVVDQYGSTTAGIAARYHHSSLLMAVGRFADAEKGFQTTIEAAGSTLFASTAKLGKAEAMIGAGNVDGGLKLMEELAAERDGALPLDGVLMQLARSYQRTGKAAEAKTTFKRVVDEFPDSLFAPQARTELAKLG